MCARRQKADLAIFRECRTVFLDAGPRLQLGLSRSTRRAFGLPGLRLDRRCHLGDDE
jgi:hypothetical protein